MHLLTMASGNLIDPTQIYGVVKFKGKGVALRNEYNKIISFEREPNDARQDVIVSELALVLQAGEDWKQPDWKAAFDKAAQVLGAIKDKLV